MVHKRLAGYLSKNYVLTKSHNLENILRIDGPLDLRKGCSIDF